MADNQPDDMNVRKRAASRMCQPRRFAEVHSITVAEGAARPMSAVKAPEPHPASRMTLSRNEENAGEGPPKILQAFLRLFP